MIDGTTQQLPICRYATPHLEIAAELSCGPTIQLQYLLNFTVICYLAVHRDASFEVPRENKELRSNAAWLAMRDGRERGKRQNSTVE